MTTNGLLIEAALAADFELWTVIIAPEKPTMEAESCAPVVGFFVWGLMPRPPPLDAKTRARAFDLEDDVYAELQAFLTQNPPLGYGLFRADLTTGIPELMFWDPDGLKDVPYRIGKTNYILDIDDDEWVAILRGEVPFMGVVLFTQLETVEPKIVRGIEQIDWYTKNVDEYKAYLKTISDREEQQIDFIQAFMPRFSDTAFPWIRDAVFEYLNSVSYQERLELYSELREAGMLHQVSIANGFGWNFSWEANLSLVGPQVVHYKKFGFWHDLEVASWLYGAGEAGVLFRSLIKPNGSLLIRSFDDLINVAETKLWVQTEILGRRVFQRNDLFDPQRISAWRENGMLVKGTNIERMLSGRAPVGYDDLPVELHHLTQVELHTITGARGTVAEVSSSFHSQNSKILHFPKPKIPRYSSFRTTSDGTLSILGREFDQFRSEYWKLRGSEF